MKVPPAEATRKLLLVFLALAALFFVFSEKPATSKAVPESFDETSNLAKPPTEAETYIEISDSIRPNETFFDIFKRLKLNIEELYKISRAASGAYDLGRVSSGRPYSISINGKNSVPPR
jgi:hypothetical protein